MIHQGQCRNIYNEELQLEAKSIIEQNDVTAQENKLIFDNLLKTFLTANRKKLEKCTANIIAQSTHREDNELNKLFNIGVNYAVVCNDVPALLGCMKSYTDLLISDESKMMKNQYNRFYDMTNVFINSLCSKNGEQITNIAKNYDCYLDKINNSKCSKDNIELFIASMFKKSLFKNNNERIGIMLDILLGVKDYFEVKSTNVEQCSRLGEIEKCAAGILYQCPGKEPSLGPSNTVQAFFTYFNTGIYCYE
ncbi:hypothetical protein HCN44_000890 [Aphidius gifuensis]|uniref:Uncharacterized protein n=2 Tax=Aphidius gifuensis TaxID=684658 RepID=A0A834XK83_APHGI|nr:hypothetical protein HCN44_000890 [Aphidius gifuensis]